MNDKLVYRMRYDWMPVLNLLKDMSAEQQKLCNALVQFCVSPNKDNDENCKFLFHFLFVVGMEASDALPTCDNIEYLVLHTVWRADKSINKSFPQFSEICGNARMMMGDISSALLYYDSEDLFFTHPSFWKQIQAAFFKISPFWDEASSQNENNRLLKKCIVLNHKGECIQGKHQYLPPLYVRKALCRHAADALVAEKVQATMLFQSPGKADDKKFFQDEFGQVDQIIPALHIGWTKALGEPIFHGMNFMNDDSIKYGNAFVRFDREKIDPSSYCRLLKIVPPETAIPLLAYSLFSIIKFFIPGYPSRISADEPFRIVNKKMDKLIFLSLKGEDAETLADAFCGAFSDYGEEYKNIDWRYRVHDGVVIYNKKFKNLNQFRTHELLQDACVLCVNPDFERNNQEVILQTNVKLTDEEYQEVREIVKGLLLYFIRTFNQMYAYYNNQYLEKAKKNLSSSFKNLRSLIIALFPGEKDTIMKETDNKYTDFIHSTTCTWQSLNETNHILTQNLKNPLKDSYDLIPKRYPIKKEFKKFYEKTESEIKEYLENQNKENRKMKKAFYNDLLKLSEIDKEFSTEGKNQRNQISKYIYLTSAMRLFCITLKNGRILDDEADKLWEQSLHIFKTMAQVQENMATPQYILNHYLSIEITRQHIIPVRTKRKFRTCGWYDSKKNLIYLPYKDYFKYINHHWKRHNHSTLPYEQKAFQAALSKEGILLTKKNGKTNYDRPDYKIVVAPADSGTQYKETVIKIQVERLSLSKSAYARLEELSEVPVKRRSRSK